MNDMTQGPQRKTNKLKADSKKGVSRTEWAYACIRDGIRRGQLRPGGRLLESELVKWLDLSRTPIREALQRLEAEGLVAYDGRRGLVVAHVNHQMLLELYAIREALEGAAARLAARYASDEEIAMLRHLLEAGGALSDAAEEQEEHNFQFHQAISRCARNRYLLRVLSTMNDIMVLTTFPITAGLKTERWQEEHRQIVDAIASRNPDLAESAARMHIRSALDARLRMLADLDLTRE